MIKHTTCSKDKPYSIFQIKQLLKSMAASSLPIPDAYEGDYDLDDDFDDDDEANDCTARYLF
jgi:hypothetical protein